MKYLRSSRLCQLPKGAEHNEQGKQSSETPVYQSIEVNAEMSLDFDVLDIHPDDFDIINASPIGKSILMPDDIFKTGYPDVVLRTNGRLSYYNLMRLACLKILEGRALQLDNSRTAAMIGDVLTLSSIAPFLFRLGYNKIIIFVEDEKKVLATAQKLERYFFGTSVSIQSLKNVDRIETSEIVSFLVSDYRYDKKEILSNLVYFSFLAANSTILDLRSHENISLIEEGARFGHYAIPAEVAYQARYDIIKEVIKF